MTSPEEEYLTEAMLKQPIQHPDDYFIFGDPFETEGRKLLGAVSVNAILWPNFGKTTEIVGEGFPNFTPEILASVEQAYSDAITPLKKLHDPSKLDHGYINATIQESWALVEQSHLQSLGAFICRIFDGPELTSAISIPKVVTDGLQERMRARLLSIGNNDPTVVNNLVDEGTLPFLLSSAVLPETIDLSGLLQYSSAYHQVRKIT